MKEERLQTAAQPVVDSQRRRHQRPIGAVRRQRAHGGRVLEEARDVSKVANPGVVGYGMKVIEVETVIKVIGIGQQNNQQRESQKKSRVSLKHRRVSV